jgi:CBS domain containing-hemolysin-like protein
LSKTSATWAPVRRIVARRGNTTGVLFLEDIIEELVGEVQDATSI